MPYTGVYPLRTEFPFTLVFWLAYSFDTHILGSRFLKAKQSL